MRISKEIQAFASGKDAAFQPERRSQQSPGLTDDAKETLRKRAAALPVVGDKHACHSDVADADDA